MNGFHKEWQLNTPAILKIFQLLGKMKMITFRLEDAEDPVPKTTFIKRYV